MKQSIIPLTSQWKQLKEKVTGLIKNVIEIGDETQDLADEIRMFNWH